MQINNNIQAMNAYRNLYQNQEATSKNLEKLSSGMRINRAADDAAGLAISEKMRSQIRGLDMAERNAMDGISMIQTAEGALTEVHDMLQRMRELSVQAANDSYEGEDREQIQEEINQLTDEIDEISDKTEFNTKQLLAGDQDADEETDIEDNALALMFQIGPNADQTVDVDIPIMNSERLGLGNVDVTDNESANNAIVSFDAAIADVSDARSEMGAVQNRMEHTINNLQVTQENLSSAESRIRDTDMAEEMTEFTKNNILNQSATAMLAQANQLPQGVLELLQ
ncbi:flagellin [Salisediminibacterium halotolerans]|uniref:Flagellin n=1 Tax=Salisediminibacterium halotolerans TaxID=517425 RepID=A0A1H9PCW6_9BACI|nr:MULTISPECIES: flagellin [Salisediminibacterium]RLJ78042.1 flagellin [Actinophytocola xinjiangensis]RPE88620.1 flagellin [Salisediminibacterium halotolerans]TWG37019.1 flagellin [Salisediminibacterium halotolerans]SER45992.1 flagellin [Salisediminibacterium haloalkalitolerans]GEL08284.1 flagellin [Salisediminibacterium halotolerans]